MIKKILPWFIVIVFIVLIILLISMKGKMNAYVSEMMKKQASVEVVKSTKAHVDSAYNYVKNNKDFKITFLEFGAKGCSACTRMEAVMKKVQSEFSSVNVVFVNTMLRRNQDLMKYYGIAVIPTQILLDKHGREYFRHDGYFSFKDLSEELKKGMDLQNMK